MGTSAGEASILVAIDDGEDRHVALELAALEALAERRPLGLVHVLHPVGSTSGSRRQEGDVTEAAHRLLEETASVARSITGGGVDVRTSVLGGLPLDALLRAAADADRIVLQRRHLSPLDNLINGPVAAGVSARADVPVVVVPEGFRGWRPAGQRLVTVAAKQWEQDAGLFERGFRLAAAMGAELRVLSVLDRRGHHDAGGLADAIAAMRLSLREQVHAWHLRHPGVPVTVQVLVGRPVLVLLEASAESDLLLISRPFSRLRVNGLGTLSRALIREAVCAVEVVPGAAAAHTVPGGSHRVAERQGSLS